MAMMHCCGYLKCLKVSHCAAVKRFPWLLKRTQAIWFSWLQLHLRLSCGQASTSVCSAMMQPAIRVLIWPTSWVLPDAHLQGKHYGLRTTTLCDLACAICLAFQAHSGLCEMPSLMWNKGCLPHTAQITPTGCHSCHPWPQTLLDTACNQHGCLTATLTMFSASHGLEWLQMLCVKC